MTSPDSEKSASYLRNVLSKLDALVSRKNILLSTYKKKLEEKEIEQLREKLTVTHTDRHES